MRAVMYVSRSAESVPSGQVPTSMTGILLNARRNNSEHGITSFLSFDSGYYLQIVEGPKDIVSALMDRINSDKRHTDIRTLVDTGVSKRYFEGFPMKLATRADSCLELVEFLRDHYSDKMGDNHSVKAVIEQSLGDKSISVSKVEPSPVVSDSSFGNKNLKLMEWPRFDKIMPTRETMELCALLIKKELPYQELVKDNPYASINELDVHLGQLQEQSLLTVGLVAGGDVDAKVEQAETAKPKGGFFKKMKGFLSRLR